MSLTCAVSGRKFRPMVGQGWFQRARHKPGETLLMSVVHPDEVRKGWQPRDYAGCGPERGRCGILREL